ncbi:UPF0481 protein-like protein [Tanacetum coccineum]|uniref:UPF0481 protein-like protein n=1 Tax=Tanacetum coccineum TaxID=301880 RepID=A0ABQ5FJ18_9ASTR
MEHQLVVVNANNEKCKLKVNQRDIDVALTINERRQEDMGQDQHRAYLDRMERRLKFKTQRVQRSQRGPCIFKFFGNLGKIYEGDYQRPHVVSIGPYHHGNEYLVNFDDNKWYFLKQVLLKKNVESGEGLSSFLKEVSLLEDSIRGCYASYGDVGSLGSYDFVEMMLLDGVFVVELLRRLGKSEKGVDKYDDPFFVTPSMVPLMVADLLKLENQLPFFVLEALFTCSKTSEHGMDLLPLINEAISLVFPLGTFVAYSPKHLLELVYRSLMPESYTTCTDHEKQNRHTSNNQIIQCVTELRRSGIRLKARQSSGILDIEFKNGLLEIPTININDFTMNLITNCLAWEQCCIDAFTYITDYIYFLNCLINGPRDENTL